MQTSTRGRLIAGAIVSHASSSKGEPGMLDAGFAESDGPRHEPYQRFRYIFSVGRRRIGPPARALR
jgi:hypothetical protein